MEQNKNVLKQRTYWPFGICLQTNKREKIRQIYPAGSKLHPKKNMQKPQQIIMFKLNKIPLYSNSDSIIFKVIWIQLLGHTMIKDFKASWTHSWTQKLLPQEQSDNITKHKGNITKHKGISYLNDNTVRQLKNILQSKTSSSLPSPTLPLATKLILNKILQTKTI